MAFVLPRDISQKYQISLQTVYNYLTKYEGKIRTKKDFWKTFIEMEDFTTLFQANLHPFENQIENHQPSADFKEVENLKESVTKVETEYQLVLQRTEDLEKYNLNLQEQLTRYGIMLTEEKAEKKDIFTKLEAVQTEYLQKVESLFREKSMFEKRYHLVLGFLIVLLILLARLLLVKVEIQNNF